MAAKVNFYGLLQAGCVAQDGATADETLPPVISVSGYQFAGLWLSLLPTQTMRWFVSAIFPLPIEEWGDKIQVHQFRYIAQMDELHQLTLMRFASLCYH